MRAHSGLLPIHMGNLKLKIKAKGYQSQELEIPFESVRRSGAGDSQEE